MRIAFVNPVARNTSGYHTQASTFPPLGLQILAYRTPPEHPVTLYDEVFGPTRLAQDLREGKIDLVAVTAMTSGATRAYEIARLVRQVGVPSIFGGIHASTCPDEAQPYFDSVAVGECDDLWAGILADVEADRLQPRYECGLADLSGDGGRAAADLMPENGKYSHITIQTSRGCPVGCRYCSVTKFNGPKIRRRDVDSIIEEWNTAPKTQVRFIVDDNFFGLSKRDTDWAKMFCKELIRRGKKYLWFSQTTVNMGDDPEALRLAYKAGCRVMLIGFESFSEASLRSYKKGINCRNVNRYKELVDGFHKAGIGVFGAFIIGADEDTTATADRTRIMANAVGIDVIQMTNLTPLPGTALFEEFRDDGRLLTGDYPSDWERHTFAETIFRPKRMTAFELDESLWRLRCRAFRHPNTVLAKSYRALKGTRSLTTALMVNGMNTAFKTMARFFAKRDAPRFQSDGNGES